MHVEDACMYVCVCHFSDSNSKVCSLGRNDKFQMNSMKETPPVQ
jgi:hypothetical protein